MAAVSKMYRFKIVLFFLLLISCTSDNNDSAGSSAARIDYNLGISFPPVADQTQRDFTQPLLEELNVEIIRIGEKWSFREPTEGNFNWSSLDERINWAQQNDLKVLLTIQSNGPDWACSNLQNTNSCVYEDNQKFKNYIELLLQRHPNKIDKIQFGNEWQSDFWYIGNEQQFVTASNIVYDAVQTYSPQTQFVLGGFTAISLRFMAGCNGLVDQFYDDEGNSYDQTDFSTFCNSLEFQTVFNRINYVLQNANYDLVDAHLYDDAEKWEFYIDNLAAMVDKPIIITEFGGPNVNIEPTDDAYQSNRLEVYINSIIEMDVEEAYFFKLVEGTNNPAHQESGLINSPDLTKKLSYFTFKDFNN